MPFSLQSLPFDHVIFHYTFNTFAEGYTTLFYVSKPEIYLVFILLKGCVFRPAFGCLHNVYFDQLLGVHHTQITFHLPWGL